MAFSQRMRLFARRMAVLAIAALAACNRNRPSGPVQIGVAGALSDPTGEPMKRAAALAAEEINATGGIGGRRLALVFRDDYGDPDSAVFIADELYESGVSAVVGHLFSSTTLAAAPVYNGGTKPLVALSPSSSSPEITDAGDYTFRICPSDLAHGAMLARWAYERLGFRRGALLYLNDEYGRGVRQTFVQEFTHLGGELISIDPYLGDTPEVGPFLDRMTKYDRPDFLVIAGNRREAEEIIRQARRRGLAMPILGGDGLDGIEQAGALANGVYYSSAYFPTISTPANRRFLAAYRQRYPDSRPPNQAAAATYDAIYLLRDVIARVGVDRDAIRAALAKVGSATVPFEGITGTIAFDVAGDVSNQNVYVGLVQNGTVAVQEDR